MSDFIAAVLIAAGLWLVVYLLLLLILDWRSSR